MDFHSSLLVFEEDPKESGNWTNKIWLKKGTVQGHDMVVGRTVWAKDSTEMLEGGIRRGEMDH